MITNTVAKGSFFLLFFVSQLSRQNPQNKTVSQHCIAHPDDYPFFIFLVVSFSSFTCLLLVYLSSLRLLVLSSSICLLFVYLSSPRLPAFSSSTCLLPPLLPCSCKVLLEASPWQRMRGLEGRRRGVK